MKTTELKQEIFNILDIYNTGRDVFDIAEKVEMALERLFLELYNSDNMSTIDNNKIKFSKVHPDAIIPSKREEDGAFDVYACFKDDNRIIIIDPHETKMIQTGIASVFSPKYVAVLKERGSTGSKGIGQRCGVIDSGYRGEWHIPITNHNNRPLVIATNEIFEDMKNRNVGNIKNMDELKLYSDVQEVEYIHYNANKALTQCVMISVPKLTIEEISHEELLSYESERGAGMLGSSGK